MKETIMQPAIAMIELIFAIVVIGITLLSAPMLLQQASQSGFVALQQEGIGEAATRVNMILGQNWDEMTANDDILPPILQTTDGDGDLNESKVAGQGIGRRLGTPQESYRSFITPSGRMDASVLTLDWGETVNDIDDIDDFIGTISLASVESAISDYVDNNATITTAVTYSSDTPTGGGGYNRSTINFNPFGALGGDTSNIKSITVTLTSASGVDELNKTIVFQAFSCNIGGYKLEERRF